MEIEGGTHGRKAVGINIAPFTDVVLVLLIIFMVASPFVMQRGIGVNLPGKSTSISLPSDNRVS